MRDGEQGRAHLHVLTKLLLAAVLAVPLLARGADAVPDAASGPAPDAPEAGTGSTLEVVTVTGTRIQPADVSTASPLTIVGAEEIKYQGTTAVENVLNRLPQFTADSNENGSNGNDGTARLNLRDLGPSRVLVLIDGQRMLPVETADVNFIPTALVERVDVVTGGASAVYGSDAVAGMVNFILRKNIQLALFRLHRTLRQYHEPLPAG